MNIDIPDAVMFKMKKLFTWKSDLETYNKPEHWEVKTAEYDTNSSIVGDCSTFSPTIVEILMRSESPKEVFLITCYTHRDGEWIGHLVVGVKIQGIMHILDNNQEGVRWMKSLKYHWGDQMSLNEPGLWRKLDPNTGELVDE